MTASLPDRYDRLADYIAWRLEAEGLLKDHVEAGWGWNREQEYVARVKALLREALMMRVPEL